MIVAAIAILFTVSVTTACAWTPLGLPYESYGEVRVVPDGVEHGFQLDGWVEQGIDWTTIGRSNWVLNTFVQPHLSISDNQNQWWNNKASIWAGVKIVNRDLAIGSSGEWGKITFGIRGELNHYFDSDGQGRSFWRDGTRAVGYMQWSFGGDWMR